mgnify:CR=1 FL=1
MKKTILVSLISLLILSCGEKPVAKPDHLIPKAVMVQILYDLALLHAPESMGNVKDPYGVEKMTFLYQK